MGCSQCVVWGFSSWRGVSGGSGAPLSLVPPGLFGAAAVLISYGAVIGRATPSQLLFMAFFEVTWQRGTRRGVFIGELVD